MATRNGQNIPLLWLHLDLTHADAQIALDAAKVEHERKGPFKLSVNRKEDGTEALVKVVGDMSWVSGLPGGVIKRVFPEDASHAQAKEMVRSEEWGPQEELI